MNIYRSELPRESQHYNADASRFGIAVTAQDVLFWDRDSAEPDSIIVLESPCFLGELVDVQSDGRTEIFCRSGLAISPVGLFNTQGQVVWSREGSYQDGKLPEEMSAGDLDGDGITEFCIAFVAGLGCYDASGNEVWRVGDEHWYTSVRIISGAPESSGWVVAIRSREGVSGGIIEVRNPSGTLVRDWIAPRDANGELDTITWPPGGQTDSIAVRLSRGFAVMNLKGDTVFEYRFPSREWTGHMIDTATVELQVDGEWRAFVVVRLGFWLTWQRSMINVFDSSGVLVYQELLGEGFSVWAKEASLPRGTLLLDNGTTLVQYRAR